jgi:hypothetical protein
MLVEEALYFLTDIRVRIEDPLKSHLPRMGQLLLEVSVPAIASR